MKPRNEEQKLTEGRSKATKPRFKIEKLEERIAPTGPCGPRDGRCHGPGGGGGDCHYNPQGKLVGKC